MQLAGWLVCFFAVVGGVNQVMKLVDRFRGSGHEIRPQPLEVREAKEFVTNAECLARKAEAERRYGEAVAQVQELRRERIQDVKEAAVGRKAIYERIDDVKTELDNMERRLNSSNEARLEKVHNRINEILEAVATVRGEVGRRRA